ncbi:Glutathione S-transferase [Macleaya cordata]|uniref:glutathione transferase n=1 Tax=Macleaya cordata TaxID=56857 RepID=A0A200QB36_MACCD|nr:Glutathione S-transferase [Macleaya cordata]
MEPNFQVYFRNSSSPTTKLLLYSFWQSSCSWRVRFALNLKGIPYEYRAVDLSKGEQFSPEFERLNPLHFVPVLVDGDVVVSDSLAILLYLEEKYPENALLPVDPYPKAVNLQAASIVSCSIQPLQMLQVLKYIEEKVGPEERLSWGRHHVEKGFIALEQLLKDVSGIYATGDEVYMADVFLAPQISNAITRFHVDMSKFPTLSKIYEACKALPAFEASLPERQPDAIV